MQEAESQRMLKASKSVSTCALKQQIDGETQELTELFRIMLALSCFKWAQARDKRGRKEENMVVAYKATSGLVSEH